MKNIIEKNYYTDPKLWIGNFIISGSFSAILCVLLFATVLKIPPSPLAFLIMLVVAVVASIFSGLFFLKKT